MGRKKVCLLVAMLFSCLSLYAQYYSTGQSAGGIKWRQRDFSTGKLIYPDYFEQQSRRMQMMYDSLNSTINYGLDLGPLSMPVVVHAENIVSNGLVMFAPKRSELLSIPDLDNYASEWYAHLIAHEYRHAVQYANLSANFFKPLSWFIGQQSGLVSLVMIPLWYLEGDAVMAETQAASVGRAMQPSFTMAYRAYLDDEDNDFSHDKWFVGSLNEPIPSHYHLGYQLVHYGNEHYGEQMWNKIINYTSRRPYTILAKTIALKKYYDTSTDKMLDGALTQMQDYWRGLDSRENSSSLIVEENPKSFTTYRSPVAINDSLVYVLKKDYDRAEHLVALDPRDGSESKIANIGSVYTPMSGDSSSLWWTEYRTSTFWDQRIGSRICYYDLSSKKKGTVKSSEPNPMYPVCADGELVYFSYDYDGTYSLIVGSRKLALDGISSVHGLAYDDVTRTLAAIVLRPSGMSIVEIDMLDASMRNITEPSRVTISSLSAGNGKLLFGSIYSGYDEIHSLDLKTGIERRLTTSRYGSFYPSAPTQQDRVYLSSYSKEGYLLSSQDIDTEQDSVVAYSYLPRNVVNLPVEKWPIANIDSLSQTIASAVDVHSDKCSEAESSKYRKGAHLFNVHSWFPLGFNPYDIVDESDFNFALGATVMSQNALGTMTGTTSYSYTDLGHTLSANLTYEQLPVKMELEAEYGGGDQIVYGDTQNVIIGDLDPSLSVTARAYMPFNFSAGYHTRTLTPVAEYSYLNAKGYLGEDLAVSQGIGQLGLALYFSDYVRMATRDILPRWGYNFKLMSISAPTNDNMGNLYAFTAGVYMPSFVTAHSININAAVQSQRAEDLAFYTKEQYPRGADYSVAAKEYFASRIDYQLPLAYPDWGLNSVVYFKRLRLGLNFDYARFNTIFSSAWNNLWSYGATLYIDMHPLRIPVNITTFSVSVYKPSDSDGVVAGVNFSLPL